MSESLRGIFFAFFAYASYAFSDAFIKASGAAATSATNGAHLSVFEIGFFITLFSFIPIVLGRPAEEKWSHAPKVQNKKQVHIRATSGVCGGFCAIYAFTNLPLAEAYALIFLIPAFVTILSVLVLKEQVGWRRWSAVAVGFIGILFVVRPGFQEITPAHLAGVGCAFFGAISIVTLRSISGKEKRITVLTIVFLYNIVFYGVAMLATFSFPNKYLLLLLACGGICAGFGHLSMFRATSLVPANKIAPTQYSQIIWAVVIGILFFNEYPDQPTLVGLAIVGASGFMIFMREEAKRGPRKILNRFRNNL